MAELYLEDIQKQAQTNTTQPQANTQPQYLEDIIGNQQQDNGIKPLQSTFGKTQTNQTTNNPLDIGQSFISGLPRTPQAKVEAIKRMQIPFVNDVSIGQDGKSVLINGQPFEGMDIGNPISVVKGLSRFVGHNFALLGQIGGLALAPETGGASALAAQAGLGALGAMAGSYGQQMASQAVSGEQPSAGETLTQGAMGATAPYIGEAVGKGVSLAAQGLRAMQKPTSNLIMKLGDNFPEVAETLLGINRGDAQHILDTVKSGKSLKSVFNPEIADVGVPDKLANRVFYGNDKADTSIANFVNTYKGHIANTTKKEDIALIDNIYQDTHKLSQEALDAFKKYPIETFTTPYYTSDNSHRVIAEKVSDMLAKGKEEKFNQAYTEAVGNLYKQGSKANMTLADELGNVVKGLGSISADNPNGVGALLSDGTINPNYGTRQERDAIGNFLNLFKKGDESGLPKFSYGSKTSGITSEDLIKLGQQGKQFTVNGKVFDTSDIGKYITNLPASKAYEIMKYANNPLNIIEKVGGEASVPISQFVKGVSDKLAQLSPELAQLNKEYANYMDFKGFLGEVKGGNMAAVNALKGGFKDPTIKSAVSDLDGLLKTNILPEIQKLGAAQEINKASSKGLDEAKSIFVKKLRDINNLKNTSINEIRNQMISLNAVIRNKFLQEAQDHAAASEFMNKPQSFFKSKYLGFLLTGHILGGPLGGLGTLGVGMAASNPRNIMNALINTQEVLQKQVIPKAMEGVGKKASSKAGQVALSQLMRKYNK